MSYMKILIFPIIYMSHYLPRENNRISQTLKLLKIEGMQICGLIDLPIDYISIVYHH